MKTVFIIGAGANVEIGMPCGKKLKQDIAKRLDFSLTSKDEPHAYPDVYKALKVALGQYNKRIPERATEIKEAMPFSISIDHFIDVRRNEPKISIVGRLAIVSSILDAEKNSSLYHFINDSNKKEEFTKTWYPLFFQKITENCSFDDFERRLKNLSFIIFNYDRCFEFFMIHILQVIYKLNIENATYIVEKMNIIHPYGTVGKTSTTPLGATLSDFEIANRAINSISTFSEDSEIPLDKRLGIKHLIDEASRIIFLGFAYYQLNLDLLFNYDPLTGFTNPPPANNKIHCYGTGYNISKNDRKFIQNLLKKIDTRIKYCDISGVTCTQFFNNFWHRLSFRD